MYAAVLHFEASQKCRGELLVVVFALLSVKKETSALTAQIAPSPPCNHYSLLAGSSFLFLTEPWPCASGLFRALSRSRSAVHSPQIGASQVASARIRTRSSSFYSKSAKQTHFTLTVNKTPIDRVGIYFSHIWNTLVKSEAVWLPPSLTVSRSSGSFSPSKLFS